MGQQQILLIVLGMIIVGIAIIFGHNIFKQHSIDSKRDIVISENVNLANMAYQHYKKPIKLGGGGNSFESWQIPDNLKITVSGEYEADISADIVVITGTGNEIVTGTDYVKVQTTVTAENIFTEVLN